MFDFHEKRKIRGLIYSKASIVLVVLLALWLSVSVFERFSVEREMSAKREERERELQELTERATALESKVEHLGNERGIEEELRGRFDVARKDEQVVIILDDDSTGSPDLDQLANPPGSPNSDEGKGSWLDILRFW